MSFILIMYLWCIFTCNIVSIHIHRMILVSRYPEHIIDIGIDISPKHRMLCREFQIRYRTLLNRKKFRTRIWRYASLPASCLHTACTVVPIVTRFPTHRIPSGPNQRKSRSKQSNHLGRINLELSQATASSKH